MDIGNCYLIKDDGCIEKDGKVVSRKFPTTHEDIENFPEKEEKNTYIVYHEGPLIRVFRDSNGIHFSNEKKIDCSESFFGYNHLTFGKLFNEAGGEQLLRQALNNGQFPVGRTFYFMLGHPKYTFIQHAPIPNSTHLYFLCAVDLDGTIREDCFGIERLERTSFTDVTETIFSMPELLSYENAKKIFETGFDGFDGDSVILFDGTTFRNLHPPSVTKRSELFENNKNNLTELFFECADYARQEDDKKYSEFRSFKINNFPQRFYTDEEIESRKRVDLDRKVSDYNDRLRIVYKIVYDAVNDCRKQEIYEAYHLYLETKKKVPVFISQNYEAFGKGNFSAMAEFRKQAYLRFLRIIEDCKSHRYKEFSKGVEETIKFEYGSSLYRLQTAIKNIDADVDRLRNRYEEKKKSAAKKIKACSLDLSDLRKAIENM